MNHQSSDRSLPSSGSIQPVKQGIKPYDEPIRINPKPIRQEGFLDSTEAFQQQIDEQVNEHKSKLVKPDYLTELTQNNKTEHITIIQNNYYIKEESKVLDYDEEPKDYRPVTNYSTDPNANFLTSFACFCVAALVLGIVIWMNQPKQPFKETICTPVWFLLWKVDETCSYREGYR